MLTAEKPPEATSSASPENTQAIVNVGAFLETMQLTEVKEADKRGPIEPAETNIPMEKLKKGQKPPQFVIFSFDGGAGHTNWQRFLDAAEVHDARFTTFLTGLYLLGDRAEEKAVYDGPGHAPGVASIGYGGPRPQILTQVDDLNEAYSRGHEIGTHYNGHFCAGHEPSGDDWTTADWDSELEQFFAMMRGWKQMNGYPDDVDDLRVPPEAVRGGRTPCLEGQWDELVPAWKAHGLTYDSSIPSPSPGISWPERKDGIWEFAMPFAYSPAFGMTTVMDYNFWVSYNGGVSQPETAPEVRAKVRETYDYLFEQTYDGNRAPLLVAGHFNRWNGDSFNPPTADFMKEVCGEPDTYCATYQDVIAWMELQDPAVLEEILAQPPVADQRPSR
ncbi:MAG TPA: polysaccharide deacetylase [Ornithinimicrobium sp.]|uniref:polysaccharide deacetylase n=1 Tax=Ornithinimicrobium sp. TaxID=1977084 RepID=UPI002B47FBA3|nr:polysaccharide deacetylase [Ornithinimicrobium sp.]HKJ12903.1 polysaccharide deacetylase [Ornithinimicrobium sp.]